jgi:hypothetical protein
MDGVEPVYKDTIASNDAIRKWQENPSWDNRPDAKEILAAIERAATRLYRYGR